MGSTRRPETNWPSNALALCPPCHQWVESWRVEARAQGFLVGQERVPAQTALFRFGQWVLLGDDGSVVVRS